MTSNNETVSRQNPWVGHIAKTMASNGKQFTVTCEVLTTVAHHLYIFKSHDYLLSTGLTHLFHYITNHLFWSLGKQPILFPSTLNVSLDFISGNIQILEKQNSLFPSGPILCVNNCTPACIWIHPKYIYIASPNC